MSYNKGLVANLAELEAFYKGQQVDATVIELMNQTNDILSDVQFMESNMSDGHLTKIRTGLPAVYWRRLYKGTPPSKSQYAQVREACGMLEGKAILDVKELELYGDRAAAFRLSEGKAQTEAMRQKVAETMFYGDNGVNPDEFNGFAQRYPSLNTPNVVNAGGTGASLTSMYLICWGSDTVHGLYPKGSIGGLQKKSVPEQMVSDEDGNTFLAVQDLYSWNLGLAVRDWRAVVRIANIDTTKLMLKAGASGYIDLQALTIKAKNMMPAWMRSKAIWYCNQEVMNGLEYQASDKGNVQLQYGELFDSKAVPVLHGRPVRQCDAIKTNETALV